LTSFGEVRGVMTATEHIDELEACEVEQFGIDILNCGEGDLEIRFKEGDAIELERAKRIIGDMLKRGYALFVRGSDGGLIRVKRFDPKQNCYVIADGPTVPAEAVPVPTHRRNLRAEKALPIEKAKAISVARTAGG